jgi:flagellar FliL protein
MRQARKTGRGRATRLFGAGRNVWRPGIQLLGIACLLLALSFAAACPTRALAQNEAVAKGGSAFYPLLDVNIGDGARLARLYIGFEAQCVDPEAAELAVSPKVREAILLFLRGKTAADLAGVAGKRKLKEELVAVMNKTLGAPRVVRLYFLQFVVR